MPTDDRYRRSPAHSWIRGNALGLVAIFIALNGTAVATQVASNAGKDRATKAAKKVKRGPAGPQGPPGVAGPPSGAAGGELAGTYPNPTVGTVAGLDVASSTSPSGGINFGADTNLYRDAANGIKTDDELEVAGVLRATGQAVLGNTMGGNVTIHGIPFFPSAESSTGALTFGSSIDTNLYRSAANTLHTDDSFDADGALSVDGNATLGNTAADTATVNAGPVNLPNATSAADGLVLGADSNLYRSAANTLHTDDSLEIGGAQLTATIGEFDTRLLFHTYTDTSLPPNPPMDTASLQVACNGEVPALMIKWPDGEIDVLETDSPESPGNSCPL